MHFTNGPVADDYHPGHGLLIISLGNLIMMGSLLPGIISIKCTVKHATGSDHLLSGDWSLLCVEALIEQTLKQFSHFPLFDKALI